MAMATDDSSHGTDISPVLYVADESSGDPVRRLFHESGIEPTTVQEVDTLAALIGTGCGPIVTTVEALGHRVAGIVDALDEQASWSDVPVILIAHGANNLSGRHGPLTDRRNTTVLHQPVSVASFETVVRSALSDRARQHRVRALLRDLEQLNDRHQRRIEQLQRLTFQLSRAEERERRRLASLLHDELQQLLVGAQFRLNVLERRARGGREIDEPVRELRQQLSEAIDRSRHLSHELSPPALRRKTLTEALRWLAGQMQTSYGLEVEIAGSFDQKLEPEDLETCAYRAVQELLFNVVKHADTDRAWVSLDVTGESLLIEVRDAGRGFSIENRGGDDWMHDGFGLLGIQERAQILGGGLDVDSAPGAGCRCLLRLPVQSSVEPTAPSASGDGDGRGDVPGAGGRVRVVIVDDHRYLREGVKALLAEEPDIEVVGEAADGRRALDMVRRSEPDAVLLDVAMPVMDGLDAARQLRREHPELRIIGLSTFERDEMGERMRRAGADTYVCKGEPGERLVAAIRGADHPA